MMTSRELVIKPLFWRVEPLSEVLIVAHGSRNPRWTGTVRDWFSVVKELVPADVALHVSFLEITTPLYEEKLDLLAAADGELLILPFFLTRSGHGGGDVPEGAQARLDGRRPWRILECRGWAEVLGENAARRLLAANVSPQTPVVVCGYGASHGDEEWLALTRDIQASAGPYSDAAPFRWASCGHFGDDHGAPLRAQLAELKDAGFDQAAVLPLFLAYGSYQTQLIPSVLNTITGMHVIHTNDAILPDSAIAEWAAGVIGEAIKHPAGVAIPTGSTS